MESISIRSLIICKLILILISSLLISIPIINGNPDIKILWCNTYNSNRLGWTKAGSSPYLDDTDNSDISTKIDLQTEGDFGFSDLTSSGPITSVTLYLECKANDAPDDDGFNVYIHDGNSWTNEGTIKPTSTSYNYETLIITSKLDTSTKVNNAQIYFEYIKSKGADFLWIRRAYLYIDYVPMEGEEYKAEVSQTIDWSGTTYRLGIIKRCLSKSLTIFSDSLRQWDTSILVSQSLDLTSQSKRFGIFTRFSTQNLYLTSNAFGNLITLFKRKVSIGINFVSNAYRSMIYKRFGSKTLSFVSNAFGKILGAGQNFIKIVSVNINLLTNSIQFTTIINEFNAANIALLILAIIFTAFYFLQDNNPRIGVIAFGGWFMSAIVTIGENINAWPQATFFAGMAMIIVVSLIMDYAGAKKVDFWE